MTARTRSTFAHLVLFALGLLGIILAFMIAFHLGRAHAGTLGDGGSTDPLGLASQFYTFIRTGKGTMAVGVAMTLVVWFVRWLMGQWALLKKWSDSKVGGYVIGFGLPTLTYLGAAFESGNAVTLSMFLNALGAGWVAAGGWEHLQDVLGLLSKPPGAIGKSALSTAIIVTITATLTMSCSTVKNCKDSTFAAAHVTECTAIAAVIDCTKGELPSVVQMFEPIVMQLIVMATGADGSVDWTQVNLASLGKQEGACILADIFDKANAAAAPAPGSGIVRPSRAAILQALEDHKQRHHLGVVRTERGDH